MLSFFGQYLVERGVINRAQLKAALELMSKTNATIGELAVNEGLLTSDQAARINQLQRTQDAYFGEIAQREGLLDAKAISLLLVRQEELRLRVGEALTRLGTLTEPKVEAELVRYKAEQAAATIQAAAESPFNDDSIVIYAAGLFPKLIQRMAAQPAKIGRVAQRHSGPCFDIQTALELRGASPLVMSWDASVPQACGVARGILGMEEGDGDLEKPDIQDALSELLNVAAGQVKTVAHEQGVQLEIGLPHRDRLPQDGVAFALVTPDGRGALVLARNSIAPA